MTRLLRHGFSYFILLDSINTNIWIDLHTPAPIMEESKEILS